MRNIVKLSLITFMFSFLAFPVLAQTSAEPVEQPDGTFVIPGQDQQDPVLDEGTETTDETPEINQQEFVSGIAVGAAVGFVGGALVAWFLKPGKNEA